MSAGRASKKGAAQFLRTTLQMIEDCHPAGAVRWAEDGRSFVIESPEQFLRVLPQYFKTRNYSSFVRQLNMYDFHKVKNAQGFHEFRHESFVRGRPDLLGNIHRKAPELAGERDELVDLRLIGLEKARVEAKLADLHDTTQVLRAQNTSLRVSCMDLSKAFEGFRKSFDSRMSKVLLQFLSMVQTYNPGAFEDGGKLAKARDSAQLERAVRGFPTEMLCSPYDWAGEDTAASDKDKFAFFGRCAEPQCLRQPLSQPLMILDKDPFSPDMHDHLKIDSLPGSPRPEYSKPGEDFYGDNYSLNSERLGSFHRQPDALLLTPHARRGAG